MQSFYTTEKRSSADTGAALERGSPIALCFLLLAAVACSRPSEKKPPPSAPAATAPTAEPAQAVAAAAPAETAAPAVSTDPPAASDVTNGPPPPPEAASLASVSAEHLLGEVRRLGGKGTLVNAWASWCGPCKHEIPMLQRLAAKFAPNGVHVVLVSLDEPTDRDKASAFLQAHQIALTSYLAERPLGAFKRGLNPRWPGMLPASFLYDAGGTLRYFWGGEAFEDEVKPVLEALAAGKPIAGESNPAIAPEGR